MPEYAARMRALADHYRTVDGVPLAEHPVRGGRDRDRRRPGRGGGPRQGARRAAGRPALAGRAGDHGGARPADEPGVRLAHLAPAHLEPAEPVRRRAPPRGLGGDLRRARRRARVAGAGAARDARAARGAQDERSTVAMRGADADDEASGFPAELLPAVVVLSRPTRPSRPDDSCSWPRTRRTPGCSRSGSPTRSGELPAVCRTFVDVRDGARRGRGRATSGSAGPRPGRSSGWAATTRRPSRGASPRSSTRARSRSTRATCRSRSRCCPSSAPSSRDSPAAAVDRWRQNGSIHDRAGSGSPAGAGRATLRAIVGQAAGDALRLDLRAQGPHALVGGTTGAGKSEFLQAWVLGMAAEYSPDRVTFLFVDYKGGSAFAECTSLPHSVGIVTDLTPYLVRRALTSLRAELHHRELLLVPEEGEGPARARAPRRPGGAARAGDRDRRVRRARRRGARSSSTASSTSPSAAARSAST